MTVSITDPKEIFVTDFHQFKDIYERHERAHWIVDEADMRSDVEQWRNGKISEREKTFIKMILRLFTQSDTDVCAAYVNRLLPLFKHPDVRIMLLSFAARETTHMKAYKHLNDTLGYDDNAFMEEFLQFEQMVQKHSFIMEQVSLETPLGVAKYLVKQMLIEGVNLFASFAMLLSFSQEGKLPGMVSVNQWSIVDESLHVEGIAEVFKVYLKEHPEVVGDDLKRTAYETARAVVAMEDEFVDLCYSVGETSCTDPATLKQYIRYVCDYRMQQLGFKEQFGIKENPMEWIDQITGNTMSNFFETTTTQYSKGSLKGEWVYNV